MEKFGDRVKTFFKKFIEKITPVAKKTSIIVALVPIAISVVACSDKTGNQDLDQNNDGPGIQAPIGGGEQTGTQTPSTPSTPDVPVTPDVPDVPVTPDVPDQPVTPDIPDEPVTPEKTEAEYKVECEEKIRLTVQEKIDAWWGEGKSEVGSFKLNMEDGTIYTNAKFGGSTKEEFFVLTTNLLSANDYKTMSTKCEEIEVLAIQKETKIINSVSEESYNKLCEYVLGEVGLEGAKVLNATDFGLVPGGMDRATFTVKANNKVYLIQADGHSGDQSSQEGRIESMINSSTNKIKIISEQSFEDFDMIGISLENMSFKQEINGEEVSMKLVKGENGKYALDFNFCSFGDDGFGL